MDERVWPRIQAISLPLVQGGTIGDVPDSVDGSQGLDGIDPMLEGKLLVLSAGSFNEHVVRDGRQERHEGICTTRWLPVLRAKHWYSPWRALSLAPVPTARPAHRCCGAVAHRLS
jgi:hypothetical protein